MLLPVVFNDGARVIRGGWVPSVTRNAKLSESSDGIKAIYDKLADVCRLRRAMSECLNARHINHVNHPRTEPTNRPLCSVHGAFCLAIQNYTSSVRI